jgi:hypothetical protein
MTDTSSLRAFIEARLAEDWESEWPHRPTCQRFDSARTRWMTCNCDYPERWMREVGAKRAILQAAAEYSPELEHGDNGEWALNLAVRTLASVWSDHPDYRTEWSTA